MTAPYDPFTLPDAGTVQFLAPASDSRAGKEGTVYGAGHITTYDASDLDFIRGCYLEGKIALIDPLPPPVEFEQPMNYPPPQQARSKRTDEAPKPEQPKEQPRQQEQPRRR